MESGVATTRMDVHVWAVREGRLKHIYSWSGSVEGRLKHFVHAHGVE